MPSPFPGMDPYIEDRECRDFHARFNTAVSDLLAPEIQPRYVVRVERRVYVEHGIDDELQVRSADVALLWSGGESFGRASSSTAGGVAVAPVECLLPSSQEQRETYLVIREVETLEIVTVIETLSPANKRASSDGRDQYLEKRDEILRSRTNLVEIDLLRGGKRLPMRGLPPGDYYAIVSRGNRRPRADVYAWSLRQELPTIPIPLKPGEPEVPLALQQAFTTVYDRAIYDLSLNYAAPLATPLAEADAAWLEQVRAERGVPTRDK